MFRQSARASRHARCGTLVKGTHGMQKQYVYNFSLENTTIDRRMSTQRNKG